ncbi:hypothetical protein GPECTOR_4g802 [Gonium pectorale]|uniref:Uncharacterized protein n=1 Tax=Gonium pectorale TaxID=33097 RepID=A0A150GY99_GONPE|nr:hypothetical protein GPECTOR_4g802 [Gonium pectorale]|eukprot:KXZ54733.1 hypothetical protein GPECTOR_4g802 [Gonium pectorale]
MPPVTRSRARPPGAGADGGVADAESAPSASATAATPRAAARAKRTAAADGSAALHGHGGSDLAHLSPAAAEAGRREHGQVGGGGAAASSTPRLRDEFGSLALLVLLYLVQGVPLGLSTGALPFMLSSKLSYTQMGIFALSAYPYSLKLLWSPIVDSVYSRRIGRRRSWILPIQTLTAVLLVCCAGWVQRLYEAADVWGLTGVFLAFVFLMATQDIAVDGWALTLLSPANVSYASTCQTVGQTTGIFTSFTVFLALQDAAFCNKFIRGSALLGSLFGSEPSPHGLVSLAGYMRFWGWAFAAATAFVAFCVPEAPEQEDEGGDAAAAAGGAKARRGSGVQELTAEERKLLGYEPAAAALPGGRAVRRSVASELGAAYADLWRVFRLPAVLRLSALLLSYRLGVLTAEGAASLKLIDKGVAKEALAFLVLFQFPVELFSAVVAGRWAASATPYAPFMTGYLLRLATAAATVAAVAAFPPGAVSLTEHRAAFGGLAAVSLATSFVSYLGFTALGSFYNTVSDPAMGGSYLTLLNTIANMGFMLPRTPLFWAMDVLTVPRCRTVPPDAYGNGAVLPYTCPKKMLDAARGESECAAAGGVCELAADGYYIVSVVSLVVGAVLGLYYIGFVRRLMREPLESWRVGLGAGAGRAADEEAESKRRD